MSVYGWLFSVGWISGVLATAIVLIVHPPVLVTVFVVWSFAWVGSQIGIAIGEGRMWNE